MSVVSTLKRTGAWLSIRGESSKFAVTQLSKLSRQLPSLYFLLTINMIAVAYTHHGLAPFAMTVPVPIILGVVCSLRAAYWWKKKGAVFTNAEAVLHLRRITVLGSVLGVGFTTWALMLDQYGGPFERGQVAFFIAITVIGCIFCLMHLPQAAAMVTVIVIVPSFVYYVQGGNPVFIAIACNLSLVTLVMVQVLVDNYRVFVALETSKAALSSEQAQSRALSSANALLANTDSLTGLPNRRAFFGELDTLIEAACSDATFALAIIDLDGFKPINDSLGHAVGDRVLIEIGRRLATLARSDAVAARLGGDEFAILFKGAIEVEGAEALGRAVCDALGRPFLIDGNQLSCGASCGIAIHTQAARSAAALYDQADYALYDAKANRRGGAMLFGEAHERRMRAERAIEAALGAADLSAEMEIHFQPIVDIATGRDVGVEALARWDSPVLGRVPTDRFIEVAERTGLIRKLTPVLLRKALAGAASWPEPLDLSFNLSAHDIGSAETVFDLVAAVAGSGVDPARITFEITETAVMRDFDLARRHIVLLRSRGLKIALDDFGAGYSSLSCVHRLPLDTIKIDRSFVQDITLQPESRNVVRTILDLCATLGLDCVVEGIETEEQRSVLAGLGARYAQGYHFARPLPGETFALRFAPASSGRIAA